MMAVAHLGLGEEITFGEAGSIKNYTPVGLDLSEPGRLSWSNDPVVSFEAQITPMRIDFSMDCSIIPFLGHGKIAQQQVFVYVNGIWIGFANVLEETTLKLRIPRTVISSRLTKFCFVVPTAISPKILDIGGDIRVLGLGFLRFLLTE